MIFKIIYLIESIHIIHIIFQNADHNSLSLTFNIFPVALDTANCLTVAGQLRVSLQGLDHHGIGWGALSTMGTVLFNVENTLRRDLGSGFRV